MIVTTQRQPAGTPVGGQFAPDAHSEPGFTLEDHAAPVLASEVIDYLGQFGDGDEVTLSDMEAFFAERGDQTGSSGGQGADEDLDRHVDLGDGRSVNVQVTSEGVIVDVVADGDVAATWGQTFDELADTVVDMDPMASAEDPPELSELRRRRQEAWDAFQSDGGRGVDAAEHIDALDRQIAVAEAEARASKAQAGLRSAEAAVVEASTATVAATVLREEPDAAVIVAVADDEHPEVMYLSEVRDRHGVTIGERFDDQWVAKLDGDLWSLLGDVARFGSYDVSGGDVIELDLATGAWST